MHAVIPTDGIAPLVALGERAVPVPAADEALVAVEAFSVNRGETFLLEHPRPGSMPGKDVAGRVLRAAADGSGPARGTRVVGHPPSGGWAEQVAVPTAALAALPDGVSAADAAALPLAGLTALRLLRAAPPLAGRRVLLTGASGGVGHFFVELAAASGARVTAVSATAERGERLLGLGAEAVVPHVRDASPGVDVVFESVGGTSLPDALSLLRPGGHLVWFGQASRRPVTLDFFALFGQTGATLRHFHYEDSDVPAADDLAVLVRLLAAGRLHPEIGMVAGWEHTAHAVERLRSRQLRGKAILQIPLDEGRPDAH
jgi:NADPH2:quinone reductase